MRQLACTAAPTHSVEGAADIGSVVRSTHDDDSAVVASPRSLIMSGTDGRVDS